MLFASYAKHSRYRKIADPDPVPTQPLQLPLFDVRHLED